MLRDIVIIGAGGAGRETALIIEDINEVSEEWNLLGFVDDSDSVQGTVINGYDVLGKLDYLVNYEKPVCVVCAIANYKVKRMIVEKLKSNDNVCFATLVHPSTRLNRTVKIGEGCIVYQNVILTSNISIGDHVIISPKTGIGHDSIVENYCSILWNVNVSGNVNVGEGVLVGSGATIIQGLDIGAGAIIGAGAVVIKDMPSGVTAVGNPTRIVKR